LHLPIDAKTISVQTRIHASEMTRELPGGQRNFDRKPQRFNLTRN
jgi:hypothetical protein